MTGANLTPYSGLFDWAPHLVLVVRGPGLVIEYVNPAYLALVARTDVLGKPYETALAEVVSQREADLLARVFNSGEPFVGSELPMSILGPGEPPQVRYFDVAYQPLKSADGAVEGVIGQSVDVTDRVVARQALAASDSRLELAVKAGGIGVWEWLLDTNEMVYSPEAKAICGFELDEPVTFEMVVSVTHPDDYPNTRAQAERAREPERGGTEPYEYRIVRPDGEERWVLAHGQMVFEERDNRRVATRYVGTLIDITDRKRAEQELLASQQRLAMALAAGRMAVWEVDRDDNLRPSPEPSRMLDLPSGGSMKLRDLAPNFRAEDLESIAAAATRARESGETFFQVEFLYRLPSGDARWFESRAEVLPAGGAIGILIDVTDRKVAEERTALLAREVDHRANNLMSVIQGTVRLSRAESIADLRDRLEGRIYALGRAHQLLSTTRWQGADLRRLVEEELLPFCLPDEKRCLAEGPDVSLPPGPAQSLAMAVHELATNAAKYGALSARTGTVRVRWTVGNDTVVIQWRERGGPPVRAPRERGFGTTLLSRVLSTTPGGDTRLEWREEGLEAIIRIALAPKEGSPSAAHEALFSEDAA